MFTKVSRWVETTSSSARRESQKITRVTRGSLLKLSERGLLGRRIFVHRSDDCVGLLFRVVSFPSSNFNRSPSGMTGRGLLYSFSWVSSDLTPITPSKELMAGLNSHRAAWHWDGTRFHTYLCFAPLKLNGPSMTPGPEAVSTGFRRSHSWAVCHYAYVVCIYILK
jgi:hypothetical protein